MPQPPKRTLVETLREKLPEVGTPYIRIQTWWQCGWHTESRKGCEIEINQSPKVSEFCGGGAFASIRLDVKVSLSLWIIIRNISAYLSWA